MFSGIVTLQGDNNTYNSAATVMYIGRANGTNRSINAAGSLNASGADYAEYIPWTGAKPDTGSVITYKGSAFVVSSADTAAFVGNDANGDENAILVTFAGQVPVKVTGAVSEGDILVDNGDGTAKAIPINTATAADYARRIGIAWESSIDPGVKLVLAAVGTSTSANLNNIQPSATFVDLNVSGLTTINNLEVNGSANIHGQLNVESIVINQTLTVKGHIITDGTPPTIQVDETTAGSGATATIDGTDTAGSIVLVTGASGLNAGNLMNVMFNSPYSKVPRIVISGQNENTTGIQIYPYDKTQNNFRIRTPNVLTPSSEYRVDYLIVQ